MARFVIIVAVAVLAVATQTTASAQGITAADLEIRVWQDVEDGREISIGVREVTDSWSTLGRVPLPLDDGLSSGGHYRYGQIAVDVPLPTRSLPLTVEVRVWQLVSDESNIWVSARRVPGSWLPFGTVPLPLDDGLFAGRYRYGGVAFPVSLVEDGVRTLAGRPGVIGYADGPGEGALFGRFAESLGLGLEIDRDGSVVVADSNNAAIRRISPDGTVTTIAGGTGRGVRDGPVETAQFVQPRDVAIAGDGSIYVADWGGHRIRKISPDGMVTTPAGGGPTYQAPFGEGAWGDFRNGVGDEARFSFPRGIALDEHDELYIIEERHRIRRLSPSGRVVTFVEMLQRTSTLAAIDIDARGNLYVIEKSQQRRSGEYFAVRRVDQGRNISTRYIGPSPGAGGVLAYPRGLAVARDGTIYLANTYFHQILELTPDGDLLAVAGTGAAGYRDGDRYFAAFDLPAAIDISEDGVIVVADEGNNLIRRVDPGIGSSVAGELEMRRGIDPPYLPGVGTVTIFAGQNDRRYELVDGQSRRARFYRPEGMAFDHAGNIIVADSWTQAIRRITPDGTVTTVAGGNGAGVRDGACSSAQFTEPRAVAVAANGDIYVADGKLIRRITPGCVVTTVSGAPEGGPRFFRDGPAELARFAEPVALAFDRDGNLLIADRWSHRIRLLSPSGEVSTFAGAGQGSPFSYPDGLAVDDDGNVFVVETDTLWMITPGGDISTLFSTPLPREGGLLTRPAGIAVASDGAIYVAERHYGRLLKVTREGMVYVVAGRLEARWYVDRARRGPARDVRLASPYGILVGLGGDLFVSDSFMNVIWRIPLEEYGDR